METSETKIARILGVSEEEARAFLARVRSLVGPSPCDAWIACCVEMLPVPSTPGAVARKIEEMGLIARPATKSGVPMPSQPGTPASGAPQSGRPTCKAMTTERSAGRTGTSRDSAAKHEPSVVAQQTPLQRSNPAASTPAPSDRPGALPQSQGVSSRGVPVVDECTAGPPEASVRREAAIGTRPVASGRSPQARVSWVLGVEVRLANAFIEHVRSLLLTPPGAEEVALCLEAHPQLRAPLVLAYRLAEEAYAREHPAERRPPQLEPRDFRSGRKEPRQPPRSWKPWNDPRDAGPDPFDPSRVPLGNLGTCPHGVPLTGVCRICSPDKFEKLGSVD